MGRWYLINLYTLSSFKGTHLLSPWSDLKIKYGIFWEVFPKGGGGPLFPNLEAKIPPKSDFFEKNKIALYGLKCKINHKIFFSTKGFPKGGGGGHPNSQNFCKITKSFLACQIHPKVLKHVFHTGGSNIWSILSIKVHLILSLSSSIREKNGLFWEFCPWGEGGSPIPKSKCQNSDKILTFFVKTKNDPYGLKCPAIPPFGKNSQKIPGFFWKSPLTPHYLIPTDSAIMAYGTDPLQLPELGSRKGQNLGLTLK